MNSICALSGKPYISQALDHVTKHDKVTDKNFPLMEMDLQG